MVSVVVGVGSRATLGRALVACWVALLLLTSAGSAAAEPASDEPWFDEAAEYDDGEPYDDGGDYYADDATTAGDDGAREDEALDEPTRHRRAVDEFSPHLAPHGVWVDDPVYGRVWLPHTRVVGTSFAPYVSGGHWELTVHDDWLWVSDYPFGWITFHYGHWVWLSSSRWAWVPGYRWAPAWVQFRVASPGVAYVGWGPAPPRYVWRGGVFVSFGARVAVPYVFCPTTSVFSVSVGRYIVRDRYRVRHLARDTYPYRTRRVYRGAVVRAPSVREARIPARYVPQGRVIGRPQSVAQRERADRTRVLGSSRRGAVDSGRSARGVETGRRDARGSLRQYGAAPARRADRVDRDRFDSRRTPSATPERGQARARQRPGWTAPPEQRTRPPRTLPYDTPRRSTPSATTPRRPNAEQRAAPTIRREVRPQGSRPPAARAPSSSLPRYAPPAAAPRRERTVPGLEPQGSDAHGAARSVPSYAGPRTSRGTRPAPESFQRGDGAASRGSMRFTRPASPRMEHGHGNRFRSPPSSSRARPTRSRPSPARH